MCGSHLCWPMTLFVLPGCLYFANCNLSPGGLGTGFCRYVCAASLWHKCLGCLWGRTVCAHASLQIFYVQSQSLLLFLNPGETYQPVEQMLKSSLPGGRHQYMISNTSPEVHSLSLEPNMYPRHRKLSTYSWNCEFLANQRETPEHTICCSSAPRNS